jgi:flavin-dependent dehydrogenase
VLCRFPHLEPALGRISTHWLSRLHLEGPDGESTVIETDRPAALMVRRVEFDALLVALAVEAGAELVTGADIVAASGGGAGDAGVSLVARDGRRFDAAVVVAADGVHGTIARRLGIRGGWPAADLALDMMEETPRATLREQDPSTLWVAYGYEPEGVASRPPGARDRGPAREGYAYIFPKRDHVNVGIGYVLDHYRTAMDQAPYDLQREFVEHLRRRGIVEGMSDRRAFTPFLIPVGGPISRPGRGRVLVAGDAAGFVNALTAEGIYYALVSGELAANAIIGTPERSVGRLAARYARACAAEIGAELSESVWIRRALFSDRRRLARVIHGARTCPALAQMIVGVALGDVAYAQVRRHFLARTPLFAARVMWERLRRSVRAGAGWAQAARPVSGAR